MRIVDSTCVMTSGCFATYFLYFSQRFSTSLDMMPAWKWCRTLHNDDSHWSICSSTNEQFRFTSQFGVRKRAKKICKEEKSLKKCDCTKFSRPVECLWRNGSLKHKLKLFSWTGHLCAIQNRSVKMRSVLNTDKIGVCVKRRGTTGGMEGNVYV